MSETFVATQGEFPYVFAWGRYMGHTDEQIENFQRLAKRERAGKDVVYRSEKGHWVPVEYIRSKAVRDILETYAKNEVEGS